MNSGRPNNLSLKYQRFTPPGCKDIGIRKFGVVTNTQFLNQQTEKPIIYKYKRISTC